MHLNLAGSPLIVLSTQIAARDLLSKRGALYSNRPHTIFASELATRGMHLVNRPFDDAYRLRKRLQAPLLNESASNRYRTIQDLESRKLPFDILEGYYRQGEKGQDIQYISRRATASVIYTILYCYRMKTDKDQHILNAQHVHESFTATASFSKYLGDIFPVLNALPRALAPWKIKGDSLYKMETDLHLANLEKGFTNPGWNFTKHIMRTNKESGGFSMGELAWDIGVVAHAAFDTLSIAVEWFILA
ncbi:hypothetical protein AAE478_003956 [Parahypoxylon ruwenzoriense]